MVYKVIGLMSGSSLDGLDIAHVLLEEVRGQWNCTLLTSDCIPYPEEWTVRLKNAPFLPAKEFILLHTAYGRFLGQSVHDFIQRHDLEHQVNFIASHGHTVFHEPATNTTFQIGEGASIAALTGLPVISDLRAMDVAYGGQGAPIVPIGDKLLFGNFDYLLNIGGIANITIHNSNGSYLAYDICPANQVLNMLAARDGRDMDKDGEMASQGSLLVELLDNLDNQEYYRAAAPKSLSNETAMNMALPFLPEDTYNNVDLLHTVTTHIAGKIADAIITNQSGSEQPSLLITGGGALNTYLIGLITEKLAPLGMHITVPDEKIIQFKEALVMALIGTLRWREEENVLADVTGASKNSIGGALWLP